MDREGLSMDDLISRQATIDAILSKPAWHNSEGSWHHSSDIRQALSDLPSTQADLESAYQEGYTYAESKYRAWIDAHPERKKGKWIAHPGGKFVGFPYMHYECDQCRDFEPEERNFCPNCGADMKGE